MRTHYRRIIINPFPPRSNPMLATLQRVLKALAAAAGAGLAAYGTAVPDGVTADEWVKVLIAALGAGLVVWAVPNKAAVVE